MRMPSEWRPAVCIAAGALLLVGAACTRGDRRADFRSPKSQAPASPRVIAPGEPIPKGGGTYKVGNPYVIEGLVYTPAEEPAYDRVGVGSFYGEDFHGRKTANGEVFDMWALTAAHPTLPLPSFAYVTNVANNRTILVRINDRGPFARDRVIDLSRASARLLGFRNAGNRARPGQIRRTCALERRGCPRAPLSGRPALVSDGRLVNGPPGEPLTCLYAGSIV